MTGYLTAEELYKEYRGKIYGYVYLRLRNHAEAEDITSDIFAKIVEKLDTFDPEKASYSTWIFTITKNRVISHFRQHRETEDIDELVIADDSDSPPDIAVMKERSAVLAQGLSQLPQKDRDILLARYYCEHSFRQIGEMLGMTEANARVAHSRALKKLKGLIGEKI